MPDGQVWVNADQEPSDWQVDVSVLLSDEHVYVIVDPSVIGLVPATKLLVAPVNVGGVPEHTKHI